MAVAGDEEVFRLKVAMENALIVGCGKSACDLERIFDCFAYGQRTADQARS